MTEFEGEEFLYVLINRSLPGMVKIGRTDRSVEERVRELSAHSGVPTEFSVFREFRVQDSVSAERSVHLRLKEYRVADNREFFAIDPETAGEVIEEIVGSVRRTVFDGEREDDLLARATTLAQSYGEIRPGMVASMLRLSHIEAEDVIEKLKGRGVLDASGKLAFALPRRMMKADTRSGFAFTPAIDPQSIVKLGETSKTNKTLPQSDDANYKFPPLALLKEQVRPAADNDEEYKRNMADLMCILGEFDVTVTPSEIHVGPVITRYEFAPAVGTRVEKIIESEKNILRRINLRGARIVTSIPGKTAIGIEMPNQNPTPVGMREIFESEDWASARADIPIGLGKHVSGQPLVLDLMRMPHLLIAALDGIEKSTCINAILTSVLFSKSPNDVRLVMIDPCVVELTVFNSLPHMLIPVVTEPRKAPMALMWLLSEMEQRYQLFAKENVRNIIGFNSRKRTTKSAAPPPEGPAALTGVDPLADDLEIPDRLPYIVIIINELADLIMVARQEVEASVARLAQHGGAAGIHLVVATQRISENVITDAIKASLPSRISFQVPSQLDSRTLLGVKGAEALLGRGDMLITLPGTSRLIRAQGAFVSEDEVQQIVNFLKINGPPVYAHAVQQQINRAAKEDAEDGEGADGDDEDLGDDEELYAVALDVLKSTRRASTAMLQRRLRIGYNRAARIMEIMEEKGIVGPENGSSPREILVDLDTL